MQRTLPKNGVDKALDLAIKTGAIAWMFRFVFRSNRV